MSATRILFVDDEPNLLEGLENLLHRQRRDWDMVFALGGPAALDELAKNPFDVIVSDMGMHGMDGAALLGRVKDEYPGVVRIVLSGSAARDALIRAVPVANQYLSKPCEVGALRDVIERTCGLHALVADGSIRKVIGGLVRLPSVPQAYRDLTEAAARPDVGLAELAGIVERDPAMCVKVLQLSSSALSGSAQRMSSIRQAVGYLGVELLKTFALTAGLFGTTEADGPPRGFLQDLQRSSVLTARLAKRFLKEQGRGEEAFTAGMIHDVGKLVVAVAWPAVFNETLRAARSGRAPHLVEREAMGVTHAEVGAYLLGLWGLPFSIVEVVACHHEPGRVTVGDRAVLAAVHVADAMADLACGLGAGAPIEANLDMDFLAGAGFADLARWRSIADDEFQSVQAAS